MKESEGGVPAGCRITTEVLEPLKRAFVGKDEIVDLMGISLVAGENLFILGPPGTAKSALVRELGRRLQGRTFEYLLTRFTEPSELFGPFDIRRLREGELVTSTEGMLPEAELVFLDELLNANSAILNSLLTVLNERVFRRGKETRPLPALMVVGASNRLPEDDALGALFDRFLLRVNCPNVEPDRLAEVLDAGWKLELAGLSKAHASVQGVPVQVVRELQGELASVDLGGVKGAIVELVGRLRRAGIGISDRRAVKLQRLVGASALLSGRRTARPTDLWVFRHIWDSVEQQELLSEAVDGQLRGSEPVDGDHPRSRGPESPDPEVLARDMDGIGSRLPEAKEGSSERAVLRDRLSTLAARAQWVRDSEQRAALDERIGALWKRFGPSD